MQDFEKRNSMQRGRSSKRLVVRSSSKDMMMLGSTNMMVRPEGMSQPPFPRAACGSFADSGDFSNLPSPPVLRYSRSSPNPQLMHHQGQEPSLFCVDAESLEQERLRLLGRLRGTSPSPPNDEQNDAAKHSPWWNRSLRRDKSFRGEQRAPSPERAWSPRERASFIATNKSRDDGVWKRFLRSRKEKREDFKKPRKYNDSPKKSFSLTLSNSSSNTAAGDVAPQSKREQSPARKSIEYFQSPPMNQRQPPKSFPHPVTNQSPEKLGVQVNLINTEPPSRPPFSPIRCQFGPSSKEPVPIKSKLLDDDSVGDHTIAPPPQLERNPSFLQRVSRKSTERRVGRVSPSSDCGIPETTPPTSPVAFRRATSAPIPNVCATPPPVMPPPLVKRKSSSLIDRFFGKSAKDKDQNPQPANEQAPAPPPIASPAPNATFWGPVDVPEPLKLPIRFPSDSVHGLQNVNASDVDAVQLQENLPANPKEHETRVLRPRTDLAALFSNQEQKQESHNVDGYIEIIASGCEHDDLQVAFGRNRWSLPPNRWSPTPRVELIAAGQSPPKIPTRHREQHSVLPQQWGQGSAAATMPSSLVIPCATRPVSSCSGIAHTLTPKYKEEQLFRDPLSKDPMGSCFAPKQVTLRTCLVPPTLDDEDMACVSDDKQLESNNLDKTPTTKGNNAESKSASDDEGEDEEVSRLSEANFGEASAVPGLPKRDLYLPMKSILSPKSILKSRKTSPSASDNLGQVSEWPLSGGTQDRNVGFTFVEIREYERAVGDNPACSSGAPLTIGWNFVAEHKCTLDRFEHLRVAVRRRERKDLYLSSTVREQILLEWSWPLEDIRKARREAMYIQYCREKTVYSHKNRSRSSRQSAATPPSRRWNGTSAARQPDSSDTAQPRSIARPGGLPSHSSAPYNFSPLRDSPTPKSLARLLPGQMLN